MVYRTGEMRYYYDKADLRSVVERLNEEEKKYYDAVVEQLDTIRNALETLANTVPLAANRNDELNMLKHSARLEEERDRFMDRMFHKYPIVPSEFVWKEEPVATPLCAREPPVARKVKVVVPEPPRAMPEPEPASPAPKKPVQFKEPRKSRRMEASREGSPMKRNRVSRNDFYPPGPAVRSMSASSGSSAEFEEKAPKRRFIPYQRKKQQ
jgi:hypothetical protein